MLAPAQLSAWTRLGKVLRIVRIRRFHQIGFD